MYRVEPEPARDEFQELWEASRAHLDRQVDGGVRFWLRMWPWPSALEHHCFRLGNQIFVVRVVDADGRADGPGSAASIRAAARSLRGQACLLPMKRSLGDGHWEAILEGWGLECARTGRPVDPAALVTGDDVLMSDWEVHHFAVSAVKQALWDHGRKVTSWHSDPRVYPTIWFSTQDGGQEWIVVRASRYPKTPPRVRHWNAIVEQCAASSARGHFVPVVVSRETLNEVMTPEPGLLLRGHPLQAFFVGAGPPLWAQA